MTARGMKNAACGILVTMAKALSKYLAYQYGMKKSVLNDFCATAKWAALKQATSSTLVFCKIVKYA